MHVESELIFLRIVSRAYKMSRMCSEKKSKGAQCSEPVKSKVPSVWFLWKTKIFLVSRKQKLGLRGQQALLEHNVEYCPFLQGCFHKKERWSKSCFLMRVFLTLCWSKTAIIKELTRRHMADENKIKIINHYNYKNN